ncbi:MAG: DUF2847 family protein [bacterium]|nr:DUF2847 family protein [bacterium]
MRELELVDDPKAALEQLAAASRTTPVVVFKRSPICPVSHRAEAQFGEWLESLATDAEVAIARVDVIARKLLARGLTAELGVQHESPQVLWFAQGELAWHDSHDALTAERFRSAYGSR